VFCVSVPLSEGGWRGERIEEPAERTLGSVHNKKKLAASGWHANHVQITMVCAHFVGQPAGLGVLSGVSKFGERLAPKGG
jgi:hypothetical protein